MRQRLDAGRHRDRHTARQQAVLAIVKAHDLVDALDSDIKHAAVLRERFRVEPAMRGERFAIAIEHRRGFDFGDAVEAAIAIQHAAAKPAALVAERNEMLAIRGDPQRRQAAEILVARGELQPAAEFQCAELGTGRIADIEGSNRRCRYCDSARRFRGILSLGDAERPGAQ